MKFAPRAPHLALGGVLCLVFLARLHVAALPLERDEGVYAYMGQLILAGIPPYKLAFDLHFPGIFYVYALFTAIGGAAPAGIHVGLALLNGLSSLLVFLLGRELYDEWTGAVAGACHATASLCLSVLGLSANAEHFVLAPALAGLLFLFKTADSSPGKSFKRDVWLGGLLMGTAFLMKQNGILFPVLGAGVLLGRLSPNALMRAARPARLLLPYGLAVVLPLALVCALLAYQGALGGFRDGMLFASDYEVQISWSQGFAAFKMTLAPILEEAPVFAGLVAFGLACGFWDRAAQARSRFLAVFFGVSFLTVCPGFYFRRHYFLLILPAASLAAGVGAAALFRLLGKSALRSTAPIMTAAAVALALSGPLITHAALFRGRSLSTSTRLIYGHNPFPEALVISDYIKRHSEKNDRIVVLGSEPQIYFYSERRSASRHIYTYQLGGNYRHGIQYQHEMMRDIERERPKFIVTVHIYSSWMFPRDAAPEVLDWTEQFVKANYRLVGIADIASAEKTQYRWDTNAAGYAVVSPYWIGVYERL